ncbi:dihydroorotate dehydrogenase [Clostridium aminobutyricum]|uniref:dihydrouracil dehydrogenase (NAD(+)) n=1 Tax=Clostridium aminobutyricum TaxID=33953 RepID=A0A939D9L7_CLOAM|nr:nitronate monooxygenase [Clostridium aminobutyricum]MBN7773655.1 nitronate monooxygenase [Clostridium aminobutyricum]
MKTEFLGLKMKNPVMVAAGPWSRDGSSIRKGIAAGAGAVVTETIVTDVAVDVRPRIAYNGCGVQNIRMYCDIQVEGWQKDLEYAKKNGGIVIASISAHTPSELAYLASKMEVFGADAIEISLSNPMWESLEIVASDPETIFQMTKEVVDNVKIPVAVKLSQNVTNISRVAKAAQKAGASGVSAINTIRCILGVDLEKCEPTLTTYGGYSGAPIRPLGLASVATVAQAVDVPICGIGGVENYQHVLEYIMLGASAVQVGTAVMLHGHGIISEMIHDLETWERKNGITSIKNIRGKALRNLKSFDEMKVEPVTCTTNDQICEEGCNQCIHSCLYGAIKRRDKNVLVNENLCGGCGLCNDVCPTNKLTLTW